MARRACFLELTAFRVKIAVYGVILSRILTSNHGKYITINKKTTIQRPAKTYGVSH